MPAESPSSGPAPVRPSRGSVPAASWLSALDRFGLIILVLNAVALTALPFATMRANRIVPGQGHALAESLPAGATVMLLLAVWVASGIAAVRRSPPVLRLMAAFAALAAELVAIGLVPAVLAPAGASFARVSPAAGFWLLVLAGALLCADALTRLKVRALARLGLLAAAGLALTVLFRSGLWDGLSTLKEYAVRAESFGREARWHMVLALSSLAAAVVAGLPLGILCHQAPTVRAPILSALNAVQTIPSIALFGLLIAPLGWVALHVPGAAAAGIRGIGAAPALLALFLYSLLPVVANTVVGLAGVPREADDAARGLGMTDRQRLARISLPLAVPVILTGIRIVLVQNIGLATIAALIGGGGLGVFVFQGIGQTATDLVLLGALPTVAFCFAAAVVMDALVEISGRRRAG